MSDEQQPRYKIDLFPRSQGRAICTLTLDHVPSLWWRFRMWFFFGAIGRKISR